jgi:ribonuclease P protein component
VDERFPKQRRIRKRPEFLDVQGCGRKAHSRFFVGLFVPGAEGETRIGITAARRVGPAVIRNRVKRIVREAFRRDTMALPQGIDIVIVAREAASSSESRLLREDLATLGRRVRKMVEGNR